MEKIDKYEVAAELSDFLDHQMAYYGKWVLLAGVDADDESVVLLEVLDLDKPDGTPSETFKLKVTKLRE